MGGLLSMSREGTLVTIEEQAKQTLSLDVNESIDKVEFEIRIGTKNARWFHVVANREKCEIIVRWGRVMNFIVYVTDLLMLRKLIR